MRSILNTRWRHYLQFPLKFIGLFTVLYLSYYFLTGLSAPGGRFYTSFFENNVNFVDGVRTLLIKGVQVTLSLCGITSFQVEPRGVRLISGEQVNIAIACLGFGIMSFWIAFVFANGGTWENKLKWILIGLATICSLNVIRISVLLVALNKRWLAFTSLEQHDLFNAVSYVFIFLLVFLYIKFNRKPVTETTT